MRILSMRWHLTATTAIIYWHSMTKTNNSCIVIPMFTSEPESCIVKVPNMGETIYNNYVKITIQNVPDYAREGKPNKFSRN